MNIPMKTIPSDDEFFGSNINNLGSNVKEYQQQIENTLGSLPLPFAMCFILFYFVMFVLSSLKICFNLH